MSRQNMKSDHPAEYALSGLRAIGWQVGIHSYAWSPPTDVYETDASFVVRVEVAGMNEADFTVDIEENNLIIRGMRAEVPERRAYHQMEIRFGEFSTAVELPAGLDTTKAEADYRDGFLTVILPRLKPTGIAIRS
jgi:HSP20 family protein